MSNAAIAPYMVPLDIPEPRPAVEPSVGRIVHFVTADLTHAAAIIVACDRGDADLYVFPTRQRMAQIIAMAPYSEQPRPGTWHYPEESATP